MHKILVFDLDGTLTPLGKGMTVGDVEKLRALERTGYRIAVCSGKPTYYLCGFLRQIGLDAPIMVGENGAVFQFGVDLPPRTYFTHPYPTPVRENLKTLRQLIDEACGDRVWYQPNEIGLTPFVMDEGVFDEILAVLDAHRELLEGITVYRHVDCFDLTPENISKGSGLAYLADYMGLIAGDFIAIGDGFNDVPMFEFADLSICVGGKLDHPTDYKFHTIGQALDYLLKEKP